MNDIQWKARLAEGRCGECGKPQDRDGGTCQECSDKAIAAYIRYREEHGYSAEERSEMRAAFGPGAQVVNVITGQKINL